VRNLVAGSGLLMKALSLPIPSSLKPELLEQLLDG
jgi:hypothetical protein